MKLNEFKEIVKDSAQFNIHNRQNEIEISTYLNDGYFETKRPFPRRMAFSALSLILLLMIGLFVRLTVNPVATLSIDFNPSIELELNVFNRVISVSGTNQEGLDFVEDLNYKNKPVKDVILTIYNAGIEQEYFTESDAYMLIGVYGEDYESEINLNSILSKITDVTILSIFQHADSDLEYTFNLSIASEEGSINYDSAQGDNDMPMIESPIYKAGNLFDSYEEATNWALENQISEAKLVLVINIFNSDEVYVSEADFNYLIGLDIPTLIEMYESLE